MDKSMENSVARWVVLLDRGVRTEPGKQMRKH